MDYQIFILWIFSFFIGSIPTAYLLVKMVTGKDVREIGSGNVGGTNARRAGRSKKEGFLLFWSTGLLDLLKGVIPVLIALLLTKQQYFLDKDIICVVTALLVILGHDTMPLLKNGSGKGVGTTTGAFILLAPIPMLIAMAMFFLLQLFTKVVSKRSIISGITLGIACFIFQIPIVITLGVLIAVILLLARHGKNIVRIVKGQE